MRSLRVISVSKLAPRVQRVNRSRPPRLRKLIPSCLIIAE
jgi:hypothetical protein